MKKKILITTLVLGIGFAIFAQSFAQATPPKLTGLENAVIKANENSNVSCVLFAKHLRYGDGWRTGKQKEVKELQDKLKEKGYFNEESTGYFGPVTLNAVKKYQRENNIPNTGNVFKMTIGQLKKHFCQNTSIDKDKPITPECKVWNDGCNTCSKSTVDGVAACTLMYCENMGKPYCKEYFEQKPVTSECKVWNDGCNTCFKSSREGEEACTKMSCPTDKLNKPYCMEYFEQKPVTRDCKVWNDGCNTCFKTDITDTAGACTKVYCPTDNLNKPYCKEYFEKIKSCPSEKITNLMPQVCGSGIPCVPSRENSYYIYNGKSYQISDFDAEYVKNNCVVKETKVY